MAPENVWFLSLLKHHHNLGFLNSCRNGILEFEGTGCLPRSHVYIHNPWHPTWKRRLYHGSGNCPCYFLKVQGMHLWNLEEKKWLWGKTGLESSFLSEKGCIVRRFKNPPQLLMWAFELSAETPGCFLLCSTICWSRCTLCHPGGEAPGSARQRSLRTCFNKEI